MVHPDNGILLALLDGEITEPEAGEVQAHLDACPSCRAEADALAEASRGLAEALIHLDSEPDTESVRARMTQEAAASPGATDREVAPIRSIPRKRAPSRFGPFVTLPRAASIALLLTGVTVSALPGSPVRRWLTDLLETPGDSQTEGSEVDALGAPPAGNQEELGPGAGIPAVDGRVEIWIHDLPEDSELRVRWTDAEEAWIFAGQETRFNLEDGRLEAFSPAGPVIVEIPRGLSHVVVGLDGNILLRKSGEDVEILGPIQQRTPFEILFDSPGSSDAGGPSGPSGTSIAPDSPNETGS